MINIVLDIPFYISISSIQFKLHNLGLNTYSSSSNIDVKHMRYCIIKLYNDGTHIIEFNDLIPIDVIQNSIHLQIYNTQTIIELLKPIILKHKLNLLV